MAEIRADERHDEGNLTANVLTVASLCLATLLAIVFTPIFARSISANMRIYFVTQQISILVGGSCSVLLSVMESKINRYHDILYFTPALGESDEVTD